MTKTSSNIFTDCKFILTPDELNVLSPIYKRRQRRYQKTSIRRSSHSVLNKFFMCGSRFTDRDTCYKVIDILEQLLVGGTAPSVIGKRIGFAGSGTVQGILDSGRMMRRSADAIIDYYQQVNNHNLNVVE
jgi:hypothetical protein